MSYRSRTRAAHGCQSPRLNVRLFLAVACCVFVALQIVFGPASSPSSGGPSTKQNARHVLSKDGQPPSTTNLGAIVLLAPQRNEGSIWSISRFCLLLRAVRSLDRHLNSKFGPYPIFILVAKDYAEDPKGKDAEYTPRDRALLQQWAPSSTLHFEEVNLYSQDALEPNATIEQIARWRAGKNGAVAGQNLGYQSMCRLWSGRLQSMSFLDDVTYYLRMDDDSLLTADFSFDPFQRMKEQNLTYVYQRQASDFWGIDELWKVSKPHLNLQQENLPFLLGSGDDRQYTGMQPYNNFHISRVSFWRSKQWTLLWEDMNRHHLFFKYRVGDANVHAIALMLMRPGAHSEWPETPYAHNSNDYAEWGKKIKIWKGECDLAMMEA
jgi:hypothetical protein